MKIICECGCNFNSLNEAMKMIDKTKEIDAFLCKFQLYNAENIKKSKDYKFLNEIMINEKMAKILFEYGKSIEQEVFFTCFYPKAVDICDRMEVKYYKIRFFDRNNLIIYRKIKKTNKPIFVSCNDPKDTIFYNMSRYQERIHFLYCIPQYPAPMKLYLQHWNNNIFSGFSDHTKNTELLKIAKDMNVDWFEVHVKLDDNCYEKAWSKSFKELKEVLEWK